jgi:hypothetical protein
LILQASAGVNLASCIIFICKLHPSAGVRILKFPAIHFFETCLNFWKEGGLTIANCIVPGGIVALCMEANLKGSRSSWHNFR